jgi:hypothetical protein
MFLFTVIVFAISQAVSGSYSYQDCIDRNFEPKACFSSKALYDSGKKLCSIQGKSFDGSSDCKAE